MNTFIPAEYCPDKLILKDPRNMRHITIISFLRHWFKRQQQYGAEAAFRFQSVLNGRKELNTAVYPDQEGAFGENVEQTKNKTARRKNKGKKKMDDRLNTLIPISDDEGNSGNVCISCSIYRYMLILVTEY